MIDEDALRAMVEDTLAPYRGTLDDAAIAEMEAALLVMFTSHPVISQTMRAALPKPTERSGERGEDDDAAPGEDDAKRGDERKVGGDDR